MTTELGVVLDIPIKRAESNDAEHVTVRSDVSLESTYKTLLEKNVNIAMITDRFGRFDGLIIRSIIEARIIAKLVAITK